MRPPILVKSPDQYMSNILGQINAIKDKNIYHLMIHKRFVDIFLEVETKVILGKEEIYKGNTICKLYETALGNTFNTCKDADQLTD